ncbi:MAG: TolC family protein [Pseudomonadota bacterium]
MNPFFAWPAMAMLLLAAPLAPAADPLTPAIALGLDDAAALAIERQPQLEAFTADAEAARARAIAAGQLPDPSMSIGITDLTLEGTDRFTLQRESDTQIIAGVRQEFPRAAKRQLKRARAEQEAETFDAERAAAERQIAREAGMAWLEVWKVEESLRLTRLSLVEAERQVQAVTIAYSAHRANQAEVLAARVEAEALRDEADGFAQSSRHYRNQLARWIGEAAFNPLCPDLPTETKPDTAALIAALQTHPHFLAEAKRVAVAQTDVAAAQADFKPDWAVSFGYGHRPAFADYANLQFEIDLPVFTANRQSRQLQSARAMQTSQEARLVDALREHTAEIRLNADDWALLQARLKRYDASLLPQSQSRTEAALAAYGAGTATLKEVLDARRSGLEIAMQKIDLQFDAAMHQVQLRYFAP